MDTYGEREVVSTVKPEERMIRSNDGTLHPLEQGLRKIKFGDRPGIECDHSDLDKIGLLMGSPVAPVGTAECYDLVLTEDGRLAWFYCGYVVTWGPPDRR